MKSTNKNSAWNFIQSTAAADKVEAYLTENSKPTALRSLINSQLDNDELTIFASQVLTADTWYKGYNIDLAEQYTAEIIDKLISGELVLERKDGAVQLFVSRINQTYVKNDD